MYFSRNSRYVLQRVRFLSPTFLSSSQKNLSVKKPKDDPTKPPLRINIPEDIPQTDDYVKLTQDSSNVGESRSRSVIARSKSTPYGLTFEDNSLAKSESEIQFSQLSINDVLVENNRGNDATNSGESFHVGNRKVKNQNKSFNESSRTVLNDEIPKIQRSGEVLTKKYEADSASSNENYKSRENASKIKNLEFHTESQMEESTSPKSLYIIIDVPQANQKIEESEVKNMDLYDVDNFEEIKAFSNKTQSSLSNKREKREKDNDNLSKKSKSYSRFNFDKTKLKVNKKFEVHEIEDTATYIFHLRLNPSSWRKPCGVGWVPEKEVSTRNENSNYNELPVRVRRPFGSKVNGIGKDVTVVDHLPKSTRFFDNKKKQKLRETEGKANLLAVDKESILGETPAEAQPVPREEDSHGDVTSSVDQVSAVSQSKDRIEEVSYIKKDRKTPQKFKRDDFGAVKPVFKTYPLRLFGESREGKQEDSSSQENSTGPRTVNEEEVYAEVASNPAAEISESPKEDRRVAGLSRANTTSPQLTYQSSSYAEPLKNCTTDSYGQYLGKHHRSRTTSSRSDDVIRDSSQYFGIHEKEPNLTQNDLSSNTSQYPDDIGKVSTLSQSPKQNNQTCEDLQYLSIHEKPGSAIETDKNKSDHENCKIPKAIPSFKTKKTIKSPQSSQTPKKKLTDNSSPNGQNSKSSDFSHSDDEISDFQTSGSFVSIGCDKIPCSSMTYGAAFPPLLREALNTRFRFRKDFLLNPKWTKIEIRSKDVSPKFSQKYDVSELSENSILFPKNESEKFDCDSLFSSKEEIILNIIKNTEKESSPKMKDNGTNFADESLTKNQDQSSIDSLTVMKKVKEIIQLDLDNAVKIFKNDQSEIDKELSSVIVSKGDSWEVDTEELKRQAELRNNTVKIGSFIDQASGDNIRSASDIFGDKKETNLVKYLPSKEIHLIGMKVSKDESDSVITFNPKTNEFFINKEALADAISRRTREPREEVIRTLDFLAESSKKSLGTKSGDSILVFDEETQSWRVDFSILEKREQELQLEKELTKRSELILETFEKFERGQLSSVPKPDSKEKKTFDYTTEKWKVYDEKKKPKEKATKSRSPFRESNAEEIRKKNSDLYEDLFVAKKKDVTVTKAEKSAPGLDSSKNGKESKSGSSGEKKEASGSGPLKGSGSTPKDTEPPKSDSKLPPVNEEEPKKKEDDNFWDSFLKMNILPRDVREFPSPNAPTIPPPPVSIPEGPTVIKTKVPGKKIEESVIKTPKKKIEDTKIKIPDKEIEEPRFRIHLPFIRDRKTGPSKTTPSPVPKDEPKAKDEKKAPPPSTAGNPEKKAPPPPTGASSEKKKKIEKKAPPPTPFPNSGSKDDPKKPPTIGSSKPGIPVDKSAPGKSENPKSPSKGKDGKIASASNHYVSDKIIEMSKNKAKDNQAKINKIETVKLNITVDQRPPSKVTEINLNKKCEEKVKVQKDPPENSTAAKPPNDALIKTESSLEETKPFYKNLEKYKTPFSDPEYEEKSMKIKSDLESNPNLKNLDNWNKTLVLHDIMKPPDNIENWLKDETDKMATLLLKILQETTDGKSKKKPTLGKSKNDDKNPSKGNPYENIRKKREVTPENFLFRVRTVNLSLENDKKKKPEVKVTLKTEKPKDLPGQPSKNTKATDVEDAEKVVTIEKDALAPTSSPSTKEVHLPANLDFRKNKEQETALETVVYPVLMNRDFSNQNKLPLEITEEIPGPEILKRISNAWKSVPILGSQMTIFTLFRLFQLVNLGSSIFGNSTPDRNKRSTFEKLFTKYGPVVNVQGPLSGNVILIHKPEHLTSVFEQDGIAPVRSVFDSLEHSRRDSEERMFSVNFSTDWGKPEWNDLRGGTSDPFFRGCEKYLRSVEVAGDSLLNNIRRNRNSQNQVSEDFMEEIRKWSLEGLCSVLFEKSFGFLEGRTNSSWIMEPDKLYIAIDEATQYLNKCEKGFQTWRLMGTSSISGLSQAYRTLSSIISRQLYQAEIHLKNKNELLKSGVLFPLRELSFTESMLLNDGMTIEEVSCNLIDVLLIGTNVINSAMGFLLYNLAQNVKIQSKLVKELKEAFPHKSCRLDFNKLNSLKYLHACLKESLRLHMPVPIFYRVLQNDILLSNYIVPKGTYVIMDYRVSCMREQVFDDPEKFLPERWLNDEKWTHPFSSFPFCHGPKAELAKRVVEMQLLSCATKIIRNFKVEYHFGEIHGTDSLITFPDKPLKLNFIERKS